MSDKNLVNDIGNQRTVESNLEKLAEVAEWLGYLKRENTLIEEQINLANNAIQQCHNAIVLSFQLKTGIIK